MSLVWTAGLLLVGLWAGCGEAYEEGAGQAGADQPGAAQSQSALINTGGGGSLGYQCTTTIDGTTCTCTDGMPTTDPQTCHGMDSYCHEHGWTIICTWPPGGKYTCSCSSKALILQPKPIGGIVYSPPGALAP